VSGEYKEMPRNAVSPDHDTCVQWHTEMCIDQKKRKKRKTKKERKAKIEIYNYKRSPGVTLGVVLGHSEKGAGEEKCNTALNPTKTSWIHSQIAENLAQHLHSNFTGLFLSTHTDGSKV
jgi:hypothetical protein